MKSKGTNLLIFICALDFNGTVDNSIRNVFRAEQIMLSQIQNAV